MGTGAVLACVTVVLAVLAVVVLFLTPNHSLRAFGAFLYASAVAGLVAVGWASWKAIWDRPSGPYAWLDVAVAAAAGGIVLYLILFRVKQGPRPPLR